MHFVQKPELSPSLPGKVGYVQPCAALKDYEEQIITYFSNRSCNTGFQWDARKIENHFKNACKQVEGLISLQEEGAKAGHGGDQ
ncbi:MAG TPA: hypothetical protein PLR74_06515 [Agriterribacter sp.]|nr:hypothetical protein [Agriterribacter sp.]